MQPQSLFATQVKLFLQRTEVHPRPRAGSVRRPLRGGPQPRQEIARPHQAQWEGAQFGARPSPEFPRATRAGELLPPDSRAAPAAQITRGGEASHAVSRSALSAGRSVEKEVPFPRFRNAFWPFPFSLLSQAERRSNEPGSLQCVFRFSNFSELLSARPPGRCARSPILSKLQSRFFVVSFFSLFFPPLPRPFQLFSFSRTARSGR